MIPELCHNTRWLVAIVSAGVTFHASSAAAQRSNAPEYARESKCLDTVSVIPTLPSIVYLRAGAIDSGRLQAEPMPDIFAQSVAQYLRSLLRERGDTLPPGEPVITWRQMNADTRLVVRMVRGSDTEYDLAPHGDSAAGVMLDSATHMAVAAGEAPFWPPNLIGDTLVFGISYVESAPGSARLAASDHAAFPVFSVMSPPSTHVARPRQSGPNYPDDLRQLGVEGFVNTSFLIDTAGHALPETIKAIWSPSQEPLTGDLARYYDEFVQSVFTWLKRATYTPARIAGCPVPELVLEPFSFSIVH